jgi:hypothetical protein
VTHLTGGPAAAAASANALGFADPLKIKTLDVGCSEVQFTRCIAARACSDSTIASTR